MLLTKFEVAQRIECLVNRVENDIAHLTYDLAHSTPDGLSGTIEIAIEEEGVDGLPELRELAQKLRMEAVREEVSKIGKANTEEEGGW